MSFHVQFILFMSSLYFSCPVYNFHVQFIIFPQISKKMFKNIHPWWSFLFHSQGGPKNYVFWAPSYMQPNGVNLSSKPEIINIFSLPLPLKEDYVFQVRLRLKKSHWSCYFSVWGGGWKDKKIPQSSFVFRGRHYY